MNLPLRLIPVLLLATALSLTSLQAATTISTVATKPQNLPVIFPRTPLTKGPDGYFYGATALSYPAPPSIYRVSPAGDFSIFDRLPDDASRPVGKLVFGPDGSLYGVSNFRVGTSSGTFFKVSPAGVATVLSYFPQVYDTPEQEDYPGPTSLVLATNGNFYGTTVGGGTHSHGSFFRATPTGTLTVLASFDGSTGFPSPLLFQGKDGYFYGTTQPHYVDNAMMGTIFKATITGTVTTLATFTNTVGKGPASSLLQAKDGNFYGTNVPIPPVSPFPRI